jgi:diaminopropionate ammonia-lyase
VTAGESGAAGLAGLLALADSGNAHVAGLTPDSCVLVVNTEGATDPANYRRVLSP